MAHCNKYYAIMYCIQTSKTALLDKSNYYNQLAQQIENDSIESLLRNVKQKPVSDAIWSTFLAKIKEIRVKEKDWCEL